MEERFVTNPHPDIEIGCGRSSLDYFMTFPSRGMDRDTGVILCIPGYGDYAASPYQRGKLRPYLADRYNCITVGVNFFGMELRADMPRKVMLRFARPESIEEALHACGATADLHIKDVDPFSIHEVAAALHSMGIRTADQNFMLLFSLADKIQYESFGLLPAIDHLTVLGDVLKRQPVNRRRIIAFGSSYGGYVALLLGKYAPRTFSMIVDNSGFVGAVEKEMVTNYKKFNEQNAEENHLLFPVAGVDFPALISNPWTTRDQASAGYLSEERLGIRDLLYRGHYSLPAPSYHIFHSVDDTVVPVAFKDQYVRILKESGVSCCYRRLDSWSIDGRIFKNSSHGMDASLRGVFDISYGQNGGTLDREEETTDFDEGSSHQFDCGRFSYLFCYRNSFDVEVAILSAHGYSLASQG